MELLSYVNNLNKYMIKDIVNKKIAIRTRTIKDFIRVQGKIKTRYPGINIIDTATYLRENYDLCINIEVLDIKFISICYCFKKWYEDRDYKVIEVEDILWNC